MKYSKLRLLPPSRLVWTGLLLSAAVPLPAAVLQWDTVATDSAVTGGTGVWDTSNTFWTADGGATNVSWPASGLNNDANFGAPGGTVTIKPGGIIANDITFAATGYSLAGGPLTLAGTVMGNILYANAGVSASIGTDIDATAGGVNFTGFGAYDYSGTLNSSGKQLSVSGKATFTLAGGAISSRRMIVGSGGGQSFTATFNLNAGAVSVTDSSTTDGYLGFGNATNAIVNLNGGTVLIGANSPGLFVGNGPDSTIAVTIDGSAVTVASGNLNIGSGDNGARADAGIDSTVTLKSGTLVFGSPGAINISNAAGQTGRLILNGGVFRLNGASVARGAAAAGTALVSFGGGTLELSANNGNIFGAGVNPVIEAGGASVDTHGFNGTISTNLTAGISSGGFTKKGAGTLVLAGANGYTGSTAVTAGTLSLAIPYLADGSAVTVAPGAILNLQTAATDTVATLTIDGSAAATGTWGGIGSSAQHKTASITGSGLLNVTNIGGTPFQAFVASFGLSGSDALASADPDKDGANNLLEFALKGNPTSGSDNGTAAAVVQDASAPVGNELTLVIAARRNASFVTGPSGSQTAAADGVSYRVEGSVDLAAFMSPVTFVSSSDTFAGHPSLAGTNWKYNTFKLDSSEGLSGKGFLRVLVQPAN